MSYLDRPPEYYNQHIDIVENALRDSAFYLHKMTGQPLEKCREYVVRTTAPDGKFKLRDPKVTYIVKDEITGDRSEDVTTLRQYINMVKQENLIVVPTLTAYVQKAEKPSFLGTEIVVNMNRRSTFKKKKFEAQMAQDDIRTSIFEALQTSAKYINNSLSGLMSIATTPLFNRSAHPTLTSTCRNATSYANMHNEQFLGGLRPYFTQKDAMNHITSVCNMINMADVRHAVDTLGLHQPTAEEALGVIAHSLNRYSTSPKALEKIKRYLDALDGYERAAVCYNDDMWHLKEFNPDIMRKFLTGMCVPEDGTGVDYKDAFKKLDGNTKTAVLFMNGFLLKGKETKEYMSDPAVLDVLDKHAHYLSGTLKWFSPVINAFWLNPILPSNHAYMDMMRRRSVVVSDTDSTIFTTQEWTKFITGSYNFDEMSFRVGNAVTLLTSKVVSHYLKQMSANSNVDSDELARVSMKNEYYFTVMLLTAVSKHYAGLQWGVEGNILPKLKPEIKGVGLRSSAWPESVRNDVERFIVGLMTKISSGEKTTRDDVFEIPLSTERNIIDKMYKGDSELYSLVPVKPEDAYKLPMSSPYGHYVSWQEIFAGKYGETPYPPYTGIKVPINLPNPTAIRNFIASIEDKDIAHKFENWVKTKNKKNVTNFILPHAIISSTGIPKELLPVLDRDTMLSNVNGAFYMILNALGFFIRDKDKSICLYDLYEHVKEDTAA